MFERRETRGIAGDPWGVIPAVQEVMFRSGGIPTQQAGPAIWIGKGPVTGYGYAVKATLICYPSPAGSSIDLKLEAELEDKGILLLYVSWIICLPIAALIFLLAYLDCKAAQARIFNEAWSTSPYLLPPGQR